MKSNMTITMLATALLAMNGCATESFTPPPPQSTKVVIVDPKIPATPQTAGDKPVVDVNEADRLRPVSKKPQRNASCVIPPRTVALVVQNHAAPGVQIPMVALTDALTAKLSGSGFKVINPYNNVGINQNRAAVGEKTPEVSAMALARELRADGAITASVLEFIDTTSSDALELRHQYSIRMTLNLADAQTGAAICGDTIKSKSLVYSDSQVKANRQEYLGDLMYAAAEECAERLKNNSEVAKWSPTPPPPPKPLPPPPDDPWLTLSDVDGVVQKHIDSMRADPVFRDNYDAAQKAIGRIPLVIVGGLVDLTKGKSPTADLDNLLATASQNIRITLLRSRLVDAKDDSAVTAMTDRIIKNGNSPTEDGELMDVLKQHGSPDFLMVGDIKYFPERKTHIYRIRLALHNLHTGKLVCEKIEDVTKNTGVSK